MDPTNLLSLVVGIIIGGGLTGVILASRAYERRFKVLLDRQREEAARAH